MAKTTSTKAPKAAASKTSKSKEGGFAVIKTGGKQYRVAANDLIKIEIMDGEFKVGDKIVFNEVLMTDNGTDTVIGAPVVAGAAVTGELVALGRHAKVISARYLQKSRSGMKKNGHRQHYFQVKITALA